MFAYQEIGSPKTQSIALYLYYISTYKSNVQSYEIWQVCFD